MTAGFIIMSSSKINVLAQATCENMTVSLNQIVYSNEDSFIHLNIQCNDFTMNMTDVSAVFKTYPHIDAFYVGDIIVFNNTNGNSSIQLINNTIQLCFYHANASIADVEFVCNFEFGLLKQRTLREFIQTNHDLLITS